MKNYTVKSYNDTHKTLWNTFNKQAKNGIFLFDRDYMEYHSNRFIDCSLLVFKNDILIAIFPANISSNQIHSHEGLTYGGLIVKNDLYAEHYFEIIKKILNYYENLNIVDVFIKTIPYIFCSQPSQEIDYLAFTCNANLYRRDLHTAIDFNTEYKVSKSVIRDVSQSKRKYNFEVRKSNDFATFWNTLLIPNLQTKHNSKPVHSLIEIQNLKNNFINEIQLFGCFYEDKMVAGVVIYETQHVAHCQYISGNEYFNKLLGLSVLLHEVITFYKTKKMYFNFGGSHENCGQNINLGLISWKEKFGGNNLTQSFYHFKTASHHLINSVFV